MKKITTFIAIFIIAIFIFEIFPKREKNIFLPKKATVKQVAQILKKEKVISSEILFKTLLKLSNFERKVKYGNYKLSFSITTIPTIIKLLKGPKSIKITIPEGFSVEQIAERLFYKGVIFDPIAFITYVKSKNLEGYLFPETYFFYDGQSVEDIVSKMLKEFEKNYSEELKKRAYELKMSTSQVIILASIIEKEAKNFEEKKMISAVFHNRLKKGWYLESCATVRYALKKYKQPLTYKDIKVDSKFNTYRYFGLPPHPICNPGLDSIKAALYPAKTDVMFFYTEDNNTHKFSKYYQEHLNKQKRKK
ncbi:MAG: endolytic transglycosylase MltG [Endomicrobia bacterium]|nr:endolytic transglycosylase MltG [Endomicrobiia bacterium]